MLSTFDNLSHCKQEMEKLEDLHPTNYIQFATTSFYKEALRSIMSAAQLVANVTGLGSWKFLKDLDAEGSEVSMSKLAFGWRVSRYLSF